MTLLEQELSVVTPDREPTPQERFLNDLYGYILNWMKEQGGEIVEEFGHQEVENWRDLGPKHPQQGSNRIGAEVFKAILLRSPKRDFALSLERGWRGHYGLNPEISMRFGMFPRKEGSDRSSFINDQSTLQEVGFLVADKPFVHGSGEFYIDDYSGQVKVDCWANGWTYGGKDLGSRRELTLNRNGMNGCLDIVKKIDRDGFD